MSFLLAVWVVCLSIGTHWSGRLVECHLAFWPTRLQMPAATTSALMVTGAGRTLVFGLTEAACLRVLALLGLVALMGIGPAR